MLATPATEQSDHVVACGVTESNPDDQAATRLASPAKLLLPGHLAVCTNTRDHVVNQACMLSKDEMTLERRGTLDQTSRWY